MSCVRFTPAVCRVRAKQDGLRQAAFLFRAGRDRLSAFSDGAGLSGVAGSLRACPFLYGDPDGVSRQSLAGDPEEVQEATGKPPGGRISLEQKPYHCAVIRNADDCAAIESRAGRVPLAQ